MLKALASNYELVVAILLFVIGFCMLLFDRNLLKKVIGLDIMDSGVFLLLADRGYILDPAGPVSPDNWPSPYEPERAATMRGHLRRVLDACIAFAESQR